MRNEKESIETIQFLKNVLASTNNGTRSLKAMTRKKPTRVVEFVLLESVSRLICLRKYFQFGEYFVVLNESLVGNLAIDGVFITKLTLVAKDLTLHLLHRPPDK